MYNPLQRLRRLPWRHLFLTALITNLGILIAEFALVTGVAHSEAIRGAIELLFAPPLGIITAFAIAVGVGALAVYYLEVIYPQLIINAGVLWALILCLMLVMLVKSLLGLPSGLMDVSQFHLMGIILGVFMKGKRYWR